MVSANGEGRRDVPLMPGGRRLLGHAPEFGRDPLALLQRAREHGDVVLVRFGPFRVYLLNSPDAIRQALVGQARKLEKGLNFGALWFNTQQKPFDNVEVRIHRLSLHESHADGIEFAHALRKIGAGAGPPRARQAVRR